MKNYKSLTLGIIVGASLMFSTQSFAAIGDKVEAVFAEFNLKVNGEVKTIETTPLVYNGTSYLPVRDISNLLGYDVTYKADSRTIELNNDTIAPNSIPSDNTKITPSQTVNTSTILSEDDAIFYSFYDIYSYFFSKNQPLITMKFKEKQIFLNYNSIDYLAENNINYYYDNNSDRAYFSKSLLVKIVADEFLSQFDNYSIDFDKKHTQKN